MNLEYIAHFAGFDKQHPEKKFDFIASDYREATEHVRRELKVQGYTQGWFWPKDCPASYRHLSAC